MKIRTKVWVRCLFGFIIILVFLGSFYWMTKGSWFEIHRIDIEMDQTSIQDILFRRIKVDLEKKLQAYLGHKVWEVGLEEVLKDVESDSRVKSAFIRRRFPDRLSVQIMPRDPVLVLVGEEGKVYPVASDGSLLPPLLLQEAPDLPLLRGRGFFKKEDWRKKVVQLVEQIPQQGEVSSNNISEIHYTPSEGLTFILTGKGVQVSVGDKALRRKVDRVRKVLRYLAEHQIDGRVIDARFSKKVVVRLRNAP